MDLSTGELPDQPGIHRAEQKIAPVRLLPGTGNVFQDPAHLGAGEVGVDHKASLLTDGIYQAFLHQLLTVSCCSAALPHDGVIHRSAGVFVPNDGGFSLVGNTDGSNIRCCDAGVGHCLPGHLQLGGEDLVGVMLHPTGLGEDLGEFLLCHTLHSTRLIKKDAAVAGCTGVQSHNVFCHMYLLSKWRAAGQPSIITECGCGC